jgi:hypothetical protein
VSPFEAGLPKPLSGRILSGRNRFVVSRDGQRFLVVAPPENQMNSDIHVMVNWNAGLPK